MNIWYIHPYAGSPLHGMSFRPYYLCKHFKNLGFEPTIFSAANHHLSKFPSNDEGLQNIEGVDYYLVKTNSYKGNGLARLVNMFRFGLNMFDKKVRCFATKSRPKVIIASTAHPFHFIAAKYYAKRFDAKLILEVRDIWPMSLQELVGMSKWHPLSVLINIFQKYAYRNCDYCVSLLENSEPYFITQGLKENSFSCIPNGIEITEQKMSETDHKNIFVIAEMQRQLSHFETIIGYTGAMGIPNNLMPLLAAAKEIGKHNIGVLLVGDGDEKDRLIRFCKKQGLKNVFFFDPVPKACVSEVIALCDAMFINAMPKDIYKFGISPNKIFDYMEQNKFIFNGIDVPNNPMVQSGCEIKFDANSSEDLARKITFYHKNKLNRSINSKEFVHNNFSYNALARRYVSLFSDTEPLQ